MNRNSDCPRIMVLRLLPLDRILNDAVKRVIDQPLHRVVMLFCCLLFSVGCHQEKAQWKAAAAGNLADECKLSEAIDLLTEAVELDGDETKMRLKLALLLAENGEGELGVDQCDMYIEKHPDELGAYFARSHCLQSLNRFEEALEDFKKSISDHVSRNTIELNSLAYYRALANVELDKAAADIQTAIERKEDEYWGSRLNLTLRLRGLVAASVIARHLGEQQKVLGHLDRQIERVETLMGLQKSSLESQITDKIGSEFPLSKESEASFDELRLRLEFEKQAIAALRTMRALIHEDLEQPTLADQDRRRIVELGFEFDEIANDLPYRLQCLSTLDTAAAYLDTRGFIYSKLPWKPQATEEGGINFSNPVDSGSFDVAIEDLNIAVLAAQIHHRALKSDVYNTPDIQMHQIKGLKHQSKRTLAVLIYHRLLLNERAGFSEAAEKDRQRIIELGCEPGDHLF